MAYRRYNGYAQIGPDDALLRIRKTLQRLTAQGAAREDLILLLAQIELSRPSNPDITPDAMDLLEGWASPHMRVPEPAPLMPEPITPPELDAKRQWRDFERSLSPFGFSARTHLLDWYWPSEPSPSIRKHRPKPELPPILRRRP